MSYNGSINLLKFAGSKKIIANGVKGIFIPVEESPAIQVTENGAYVNIRVFERESTFGEKHFTHAIAVSLSKKKREELEAGGATKEEIYALSPYLGNLETYEPSQAAPTYEDAEVTDDDLPF